MPAVARRRAEHQQLLRRAERGIDAAVLSAISTWLDAVRFALVDELAPRRVAAAGEYAVDAAVARTWGVWQDQLEQQVLPTVSVAFGDAFQQVRRADPSGAFRLQQEYLDGVSDRLRIWPAGAFDDIRPELLESLSDAVTIDEMTERIGRVLTIDAKSRKLRAQIGDVEQQLADPDLDPGARAELVQWRRDLWEEHDESLNEWQWRARRIARTESHGAVSAGQLAAAKLTEQQTGLRMWKRWLSTSDGRTRASHRVADGQAVPLDQPFRVGGFLLDHPADAISVAPHEVINCFVADTAVLAPDLIGSMRSRYTGPMVTVHMASGGVLTGTPNHPMLTERGWVGLGQLHEGDQMVRTGIGDGVGTRVDPEVDDTPTTLGEIHRSLSESVDEKWITRAAVDFHGDISDGQVEVVRAGGELRSRLDAAHREHVGDYLLEGRSASGEVLPCDGSGGEFSVGADHAAHGVVSSGGEPGAFGGAGLTHARVQGIGSVARRDTVFEQDAPHDVSGHTVLSGEPLLRRAAEVTVDQAASVEHVAALLRYARVPHDPMNVSGGDAEAFGNVLRGLAGTVAADRVVAVDVVESWSGHVFTLHTGSAMFLAEGYITRNCRCTMLIYDDDELQDEFDEQGGKGPVEPGAVRIGPDDADAADDAIAAVADSEDRALPRLGQRGEDHGQALPADPVDVEITDERTPIPMPDLETASDQRIADYLIRTDERDGDPDLRAEADAELARRRESEAFEAQIGRPADADDVIEIDDDGAWLDDPRWSDGDIVDGNGDVVDHVEPDEDYDPDLDYDDLLDDEARLPGDAVPADPPTIPEPLDDTGDGNPDLAEIDAEMVWAQDELTRAVTEDDADYMAQIIEYIDDLEKRRAEAVAQAATPGPEPEPDRPAGDWWDDDDEPTEPTLTREQQRRADLMRRADEYADEHGIEFEQALAEVQGLELGQVRRREFVAEGKRQGLVSSDFEGMLSELHRRFVLDWLITAEAATNGQTVKPRYRDAAKFTPDMLWSVNDNTARKYVSDEMALWFDEQGARITKADLESMIEAGLITFDADTCIGEWRRWPGRRIGGDYLA